MDNERKTKHKTLKQIQVDKHKQSLTSSNDSELNHNK